MAYLAHIRLTHRFHLAFMALITHMVPMAQMTFMTLVAYLIHIAYDVH